MITRLASIFNSARTDLKTDRTLEQSVRLLTSRFSELWNRTTPLDSPVGKIHDASEQRANELRIKEILPERSRRRMSRDETRMRTLRLKNGIRDLVLESMAPGNRTEISEFLDSCFDAGDEFTHRAKDFDGDLRGEGIFQALRNLWIINSIQAGFGMPVRVNPSSLAYSLLYTYTDNFLDDNTVSRAGKEEFGVSFGRRLAGLDVDTGTDFLAKVGELVTFVEKEYPRDLFPGVYASLLAIHSAQQDSLRQRADAEPDVLSLSVRKGGTSVLADGYLVKGRLSPIEREFCFGYGVFLQLIDDLQDVEEDLAAGSRTLFTRAAESGTLDNITMRLAAYIQRVLQSASRSRLLGLTELILQGCNGLIIESVALHPHLFSGKFAERLEPFSPLTYEAIRSIHEQCGSLDMDFTDGQDDLDLMDHPVAEKVYCHQV